MNTTGLSARDAVDLVLDQTKGLRCYLTGSAASAAKKDIDGIRGYASAYSDVDLFVGTDFEWVRSIQRLIDHGYEFGPRMEMLWNRVLHFGTKGWHTNSMKLLNPQGVEVNIIYKTIGRHPTGSLSQVLETFDFGLLGMGWETEDGTFRDLRPYMFGPKTDLNGPLPLLPWRREQFVLGHFREYQGLRTFGRAERYFNEYGYDGSAVLPDIIEGYRNAALYYSERDKPEMVALGQMYTKVAQLLVREDWAALAAAARVNLTMSTIDELYEFLIEP